MNFMEDPLRQYLKKTSSDPLWTMPNRRRLRMNFRNSRWPVEISMSTSLSSKCWDIKRTWILMIQWHLGFLPEDFPTLWLMPVSIWMDQNPLSNGGTPLRDSTGLGSRNKPSIATTTNHQLPNHKYLTKGAGKDSGTTIEEGERKPLTPNSREEIPMWWTP